MESTDSHHHHHQLQDQLVGSSSSSSLTSPSCFEVGTTSHAWTTPTSILNSNGFISSSYPSETILNPRDQTRQHQVVMNNSTLLSWDWANSTTQNFTNNNNHQSTSQDLQLSSRIKEELSDHYFRNYMEILSSSRNNNPPSRTDDHDLGNKFLLKSFSSGDLVNKIQLSPVDLYSNNNNNGAANMGRGISQIIYPSINVSNLNHHHHHHQTGFSNQGGGSLDMNLEALDLLASSRFGGNFGASSQNQVGFLRDGLSYNGFDHMMQQQQSHQVPFYGSSKASASSNGVVETKRCSSKVDPKAPIQNAPKKSRLEARASCPPFKVRKEKLGDRIAALQQLVAPFGKTDTASVLMEAIGYIKFLQSQVETLSVPYMKASRSKSNRVIKGGPDENGDEEQKRDLKSRGLCLVPLSCLSYITDGGGAAVWPPPHFGGAT